MDRSDGGGDSGDRRGRVHGGNGIGGPRGRRGAPAFFHTLVKTPGTEVFVYR